MTLSALIFDQLWPIQKFSACVCVLYHITAFLLHVPLTFTLKFLHLHVVLSNVFFFLTSVLNSEQESTLQAYVDPIYKFFEVSVLFFTYYAMFCSDGDHNVVYFNAPPPPSP